MITWMDTHSSFLAFIIILILALVIFYYTFEVRQQARYAHKTLDLEIRRIKNTGMNYCYLLNTEFSSNQSIFTDYINDRVKFEDTAVAFYNLNSFQSLKSDIWDKIKTKVPEYFSGNLMFELVEYYEGIDILVANTHLNNEQKYELVEAAFKSMYKCISLMEQEFKIELRKRDVFSYEDCTIRINLKTGEITVTERS